MIIIYFLAWTLMLYWIHRLGHRIPIVRDCHRAHHQYIATHETKWHWSNLLLFNDNLKSTIDLWITEVIPTLIFSAVTGQWWIAIFYYVWAAFVQESLEHNKKINWPLLTCGQWHLMHHRSCCNYGLFFPLWDIVFGTNRRVYQ